MEKETKTTLNSPRLSNPKVRLITIKKFKHKTLYLITLSNKLPIGFTVLVLLILCYTVYLFGSSILCDLQYTKLINNAIPYTGKEFGHVAIPKDINVFFVDDVFMCAPNKVDKQGLYLAHGRRIYLEENDIIKETESTLVHEMAHDTYYYQVKDANLMSLRKEYSIVCKDENEYYAYQEAMFERAKIWWNKMEVQPNDTNGTTI